MHNETVNPHIKVPGIDVYPPNTEIDPTIEVHPEHSTKQ